MSERPASQKRRGLLLIVSSPSGAGKTTLTRLLMAEKDIDLSISVTTRPRRPSEVDGKHYHFIDAGRFEDMRDRDELLEWAKVHGHYYGSPRLPVEQALAAGRDILFDIDWQGTQQVYKKMRPDIVSVFILPPSARELKTRLERRAEDAPEVIARRLQNARIEIGHWWEYDHVLVNDDLQTTYAQLKDILAIEAARRERKAALNGLVETLKAELDRISRT
jgi:guanylate kinase